MGTNYQTIVDLEATQDEAPALDRVVTWLIENQIIQPERPGTRR